MYKLNLTSNFRAFPVLFLAIICVLVNPLESFADGFGKIVVANRVSGTISVIDAGTDQVFKTVDLPAGDNPPDPMYVVNTPDNNRVWVGDRANNRVVVFNGNTFDVETSLPAGNGVFHMWADQAGQQLWIVNDIDKTVTVVDPQALQVITTVAMPADLVADGAKPHDVMLDFLGNYAYVTFLDTPDTENDIVVQFDTSTFQEIDRELVGEDPHISYNRKNDQLYMPCQGSDSIFILDAVDLDYVDEIPLSGAHGAITSTNSKLFYTTNLPGGGVDAVSVIETTMNSIAGSADSNDTVPHNVALTPNGKKLYVTHSGATNNTVSVYLTLGDTDPIFLDSIEVGFNPFGLAHVR